MTTHFNVIWIKVYIIEHDIILALPCRNKGIPKNITEVDEQEAMRINNAVCLELKFVLYTRLAARWAIIAGQAKGEIP